MENRKHSLWMRNSTFDLLLLTATGFPCLLLLIPYILHGDSVIFPIYNFYLVFFGLPHNFLTWVTIFPKTARNNFNIPKIFFAGMVCFLICLMLPLSTSPSLNNWILSFISYYSLWHGYRQHHGICKVYDMIQSKRFNDPSIFEDRKWLNLGFGLSLFVILVWAFTHENFVYLLSSTESYPMVYPYIPKNILYYYTTISVAVLLYGLKIVTIDRARKNKFIPWPQLILMTSALTCYVVPYFFIPVTAMPLAVAIATIFHNIQYFGFVWLYEQERSDEFKNLNLPMSAPQNWALNNNWGKYFGLAFVYSISIIGLYFLFPKAIALTFLYFLSLSHYIIDGYIWRRDQNQMLGQIFNKIALKYDYKA